jgi:hypothetical protein
MRIAIVKANSQYLFQDRVNGQCKLLEEKGYTVIKIDTDLKDTILFGREFKAVIH